MSHWRRHLTYNADLHTAAVSSWVIALFGLSWSSEVLCRTSLHYQSAASLRCAWPSISRSCCVLWGSRQGLLGSLEEEEGGFTQSHHSSFTFRNLATCLVFSISHSSLTPSPWGVMLSPPIFINVSFQFRPSPLFPPSLPALQPAWWKLLNLLGTLLRGMGLWRQVGWLCVYLSTGTIRRAVWRRVATDWPCLWSKRVNGDGSLSPTHTLHIRTKESHSLGQTVPDTVEDRPSCTPFIPSRLSFFLFPMPLSLSV